MIIPLDLSEFEIENYKIDDLELVIEEEEIYVLTEFYYIEIKDKSQFLILKDKYFIVSVDKEDKIEVKKETFEKILELLKDKGKI